MLNSRQKEAAEAREKRLLIVAGAGTGKTNTLTNRIAYLIKEGVRPDSICALTFTNKAAREMGERVRRLVGPLGTRMRPGRDLFGAPEPFLGTFHSFGARVLRREAALLGRNSNFVIYDDHDSFQVVKKMLKKYPDFSEGPAACADYITRRKNGMAARTGQKAAAGHIEKTMASIFAEYERTLAENNAFDFDDLVDKVATLLEEHPERRTWYERRFHHILVDEYQDVNGRQYALIRLLVGPHGTLSVVGDDQQTIYSWRGSNVDIFLGFEKEWPESRVVLLEQNYRSSSTIIEAASALIAHNAHQKTKKLWTENDAGDPIVLYEAYGENDEASWAADHVATLRATRPRETVALLYRTNAQSRPVEQALIERQIPYRVYGGLKFYERREVKDVMAALRYAANPRDAVSEERLTKTFSRTIARALIPKLAGLAAARPHEIINEFLAATRYLDYLKKNLTNPEDRLENIAELLRFAHEFETLPPLLEHISLLQATDEREHAEPPLVTLMTLHLAKGLEFDHVVIVGCNEGLLPHGRALGSERELEEERRLMYVGMTRARRTLALGFYDVPSRFLGEIPGHFLELHLPDGESSRPLDDEERYITLD